MKPEALVFDFDGLILDTETSEFETVRDVYADHGVVLTEEEWRHRIGTHTRHWLDDLEDVVGPLAEREEILLRRRDAHHERILAEAVLPGINRLIVDAEARGLRLGVASSSSYDWVGGHLERLGLLDRFACVGCRTDVLPPKPEPDVYLHVYERLEVDPAVAVAFEDSLHGVRAAKAAGLRCVAVPGRMTLGVDLSEADLVVRSLADHTLDDLLAAVG